MGDLKSTVGVVLAAGLGNRLRPSTLYCPKPLIPVAGVEPLFFALHQFQEIGIKRVIVNVHYLPMQITEALSLWKIHFPEMEFRVSYEMAEILGTGGALIKIVEENGDWIQDSGILLQNGDTLASFDLLKLVERIDQSTLATSFRKDFLEKYNPLWLNAYGAWAGIGKDPKSEDWLPAHFFGVHYLSSNAVRSIKTFCGELRSIDLFNGIYRPLSDHGFTFKSVEFLKSTNTTDFWFDMNNKEFLLNAQEHLLSEPNRGAWSKILEHRHPGIKEIESGVWVKGSGNYQGVNFSAPVVFVEENSSFLSRSNEILKIGPSVSWVQEKSLEQNQHPQNIKNSVVMLKKAWQHDIPQDILNDIVLA